MNKHEKFRKAIAHLKGMQLIVTLKDLAEKTNYNYTNVSSANKGNDKYLSKKFFKAIVSSFPEANFNVDWFINDVGEMLTEPKLTAKERLDKLCDFTGKSTLQIANDIEVSYALFTPIENETNTDITKDVGERIVKAYPGINLDWVLTGKGDMLNKNSDAQLIPTNYMKIPKVPVHAQAGFLVGYGDAEYMEELPTEIWEVDTEYKGKYICFEVKGDSMDNGTTEAIIEGDRLLCREIQCHHWQNKLHIKRWQNFVIAHKSEGILIKRITNHDTKKGIITCHSLNSFYDDIVVNLNDVIALFNVVDFKRSLRQ